MPCHALEYTYHALKYTCSLANSADFTCRKFALACEGPCILACENENQQNCTNNTITSNKENGLHAMLAKRRL